MINLIIYLDRSEKAKDLVNDLLENRLVASASIDSDNEYFTIIDDQVTKTIHTVITAQTKANLFSKVSDFIVQKHGIDPPIFSLPITQTNDSFADDIRSKTEVRANASNTNN